MADAMSRVDQVTQQNAPAAEELAATAEHLSEQAARLQELVRWFRLDSDRAGASLPTAIANDSIRRLASSR
jgi:methyl-accepting chemotaxis protein